MEKMFFHHALKILKDVCIGCSHCMRVCPTEALRVYDGKANLIEDRCIDCGECFRVCPVHAIIIEQDDFRSIFDYKHRVALVPSVLIGQFPDEISPGELYGILMDVGFTWVYEVEHGASVLNQAQQEYAVDTDNKPLISSFCPAIIRLIQVKFPSLVDNIMLLRPPLDVSAIYCRKVLVDKGAKEEEIGVFYITPCAAKIAAVKAPVGEGRSRINGVINMDFIYNRIYKALRQRSKDSGVEAKRSHLISKEILWSLTSGEADHAKGRCLAIDEVHNVIEFLEKLENEEINDIDFLELRACDQSCAGGVLTTTNRFLTVERLRKRAANAPLVEERNTSMVDSSIETYGEYLMRHIRLGSEIKPRSMYKLDEDMAKAMRKMQRARKVMCYLPGVDCGVCGAPSCQALAEDIVQKRATVSQCIYVQHMMEKTGTLDAEHASRIMEKIWGKDKFIKNCYKKGADNESL